MPIGLRTNIRVPTAAPVIELMTEKLACLLAIGVSNMIHLYYRSCRQPTLPFVFVANALRQGAGLPLEIKRLGSRRRARGRPLLEAERLARCQKIGASER